MKKIDRWKRGLPYTGNKGQKAQQIMNILPDGDRLIDVFGGGGSVSLHAISSGKYKNVLYNDRIESVVKLLKVLINGDPYIDLTKYACISRDEFIDWRDNKPDSIERTLILICYSFGNNMRNYLWSKDNEEEKIQLTQALFYGNTGTQFDELFAESKNVSLISEKYSIFHKWRKDKLNINSRIDSLQRLEQLERLDQLEQLQRLEQLERLQRLEQLERLHQLQQLEQLDQLQQLERLEYLVKDYHQLNIKSTDIVYCDPPYINTGKSYGEFDNDDFDNWMNKLPTDKIYISEYTVLPNTVVVADLGKKQNFVSTQGDSSKSELLLKYIHH